MSEVSMAEVPMERCLVDMPYDILFEILRRLPKRTFVKVSRLCSKLKNVAEDARFWKNVYIRYRQYDESTCKMFAFEELYSQPSPVKRIDLTRTWIKRPVSLQIDQVVKVTRLDLSSITTADKCTMDAILAKYQCTKLYLDFFIRVGLRGSIMDIAPEAFLKQSALEMLGVVNHHANCYMEEVTIWLAQVLSNCKRLKTLDLSGTLLTNSEMLRLLNTMPTSLEKLLLKYTDPEDSFFKSLAEINPNLKELGLSCKLSYPSLLKFQFLETLHILPDPSDIFLDNRLYMNLIKFPTLKTVYVDDHEYHLERLRGMLEPHGIKYVGLSEVEPEFIANHYNYLLV